MTPEKLEIPGSWNDVCIGRTGAMMEATAAQLKNQEEDPGEGPKEDRITEIGSQTGQSITRITEIRS